MASQESATSKLTVKRPSASSGLQSGIYKSIDEIAKLWQADQRFKPLLAPAKADPLYAGWQQAVTRVKTS